MATPIRYTVTIFPDGHIEATTDDPNDFERAREHIMNMMRHMGDTLVETECLSATETDNIVNRLAAVLRGPT